MSFPRYAEYKDSGVEWLGEVPSHWTADRLKWRLLRNDGGVWGSDPLGEADTLVLRSTEQTVNGRWQIDDPAYRRLTASEKEAARLVEGDLLLTKSSGSALHIGKTTLVDKEIAAYDCCYSNFMQRLRPAPSLVPKLGWYILNSRLAREQFDLLSNSTTGLANLNGSIIGDLLIPVAPTDAEQSAIAAFLDRETGKIDVLVAEQEMLIGLLKEKRQAVISHAVTKGLDPTAPMKDSGIEWLGEVPEHWKVVSLKTLVSLATSGPRGWSDLVSDEGAAFFQSQNIGHSMEVAIDEPKRLIPPLDADTERARLNGDDVVICITGARTGAVAHIPQDIEEAYINQHVCLLRPASEMVGRFLAYSLFSFSSQEQLSCAMYGLKQGLGLEQVRATVVACPDAAEQQRIVDFLDQSVDASASLITEAQRAIDLLKERRSALISAAVTGKIDVRGLVAADVTEAA